MRGFQRIRVESLGDSAAADRLREYLHGAGYTLVSDDTASVTIAVVSGASLGLDSVDAPLEARILANLEELDDSVVALRRAGGNRDPRRVVVTVPPAMSEVVARAVFRAIEQVAAADPGPPADPGGDAAEPEIVRVLRAENRQLRYLVQRATEEREAKILEQQARFDLLDLIQARFDTHVQTLAAQVASGQAAEQVGRAAVATEVAGQVQAVCDAFAVRLTAQAQAVDAAWWRSWWHWW